MKELYISQNDGGQRLDRFLCKSFPALNQGMVQKQLRKKAIKVNRTRPAASYALKPGDVIQLYLPDTLLSPKERAVAPVSAQISVLYEDEHILLVDKPVGLVVHEDERGDPDTLIARILAYLMQNGDYQPQQEQSFCPALCNRIDRNTGGIVIAAKNAAAQRMMAEKIRERELSKRYRCIVVGCLPKKEATLTAYLEKHADKNRVSVSDKKTSANKTILTHYRVLAERSGLSLLEVDLLTGRTHQIRAHFAHIGHPLLGDGKYGNYAANKAFGIKTQALYSHELIFSFKTNAGVLAYLTDKRITVPHIWFEPWFHALPQKADNER